MIGDNVRVEPPLIAPVFCGQCRAANASQAQQCWLCHAPLNKQVAQSATNPYAAQGSSHKDAPVLPIESSPTQSRVEQVFLGLLVAIVVLSLLVAIGLGAQDPGLLTLFLIVIVPSLIATGVRGLYSVAKGEQPKPSKMFMTFVYSAIVTMGLGALLVVCSVIFLFMMCAQALNGMH